MQGNVSKSSLKLGGLTRMLGDIGFSNAEEIKRTGEKRIEDNNFF